MLAFRGAFIYGAEMGSSRSKSSPVGERWPLSCMVAGGLMKEEGREPAWCLDTDTLSGKPLLDKSIYRGCPPAVGFPSKGCMPLGECTPSGIWGAQLRITAVMDEEINLPWVAGGMGELWSSRFGFMFYKTFLSWGVCATHKLSVWWRSLLLWHYIVNWENKGMQVFAFCCQATSL